MKRLLCSFAMVLVVSFSLQAQGAPDAAELTTLLNEFLAGAGHDDIAIHDRFWANDLIYTGSAGRRVNKTDIMSDLRKPKVASQERTTYGAEEIRIQQYGNTAIVAFRLVGTVERGKKTEVTKYLNTGTFLKRDGKWQAVAWQATRLPRPDELAKGEVTAADIELHQSVLTADVISLESLLDKTFIWTQNTGERINRQELVDSLKAGRLKFSKLETNGVTVSVTGDTAVVRGNVIRQHKDEPAASSESYTLTLTNKAGPWKAVALHSSRMPEQKP